jgi:hypothetical protein
MILFICRMRTLLRVEIVNKLQRRRLWVVRVAHSRPLLAPSRLSLLALVFYFVHEGIKAGDGAERLLARNIRSGPRDVAQLEGSVENRLARGRWRMDVETQGRLHWRAQWLGAPCR